MGRRLGIAAGATALIFAAFIAVIAYATRPLSSAAAARPSPETQGTAAAAQEPGVAVTLAPGTLLPSAATMAGVPTPGPAGSREFAPPPSVPTPRPRVRPDWLEGATQKLGPRRDPTPLGPLRPYVAAGMSKLQVAVAACANEAPPSVSAGDRTGRTVLTLQLETLDNQFRIAEVEPADGAAATDWRVLCAQRKLRGQVIYAPSKAGKRLEVPFVLNL